MKRWNKRKFAENMAKTIGIVLLTAQPCGLQLVGIGLIAWAIQ